MRNFVILCVLINSAFTTLFEDKNKSFGEEYEMFKQMPKLNPEQLEEVVKGFHSVMHLMAIHNAPKGTDFTKTNSMERVLAETHAAETEENQSFMEKVDGQLVGLKGDINQSRGLTDSVGDILLKARGYFDQVKQAKENLSNPTGMIGDAISGAVGDFAGSFGFRRNLEEETTKEENGKIYFKR